MPIELPRPEKGDPLDLGSPFRVKHGEKWPAEGPDGMVGTHGPYCTYSASDCAARDPDDGAGEQPGPIRSSLAILNTFLVVPSMLTS